LKNALVAFFNLAKCGAKLRTARKKTTHVAILSSHPAMAQPVEYFNGLAGKSRQRPLSHARRHALDLLGRLDKNSDFSLAGLALAVSQRVARIIRTVADMSSQVEKLKQDYTDKFVVVDPRVPELKRFDGYVGQVKTVNMSGRALVQFDAWSNIGWYDIDVGFLKVVPKPQVSESAKEHAAKPAAAKPAAKAAPAATGEKKLSPLEMARMQGAAQTTATKPPAEKPTAATAGAKKSTADILAAARAGKAAPTAAAANAPAAAPRPAAKPTPAAGAAKMSTADILAAARAKKAAEPSAAVAEPAADQPPAPAASAAAVEAAPPGPPAATEKTGSAKPAFAPGQRPSVAEILDWCRKHDSK
jgi:hypothetical protein